MIDQSSRMSPVMADKPKTRKGLSKTFSKVLSRCKKLRKTVRRAFTKHKDSYDVTQCFDQRQQRQPLEKFVTKTTEPSKQDADVSEDTKAELHTTPVTETTQTNTDRPSGKSTQICETGCCSRLSHDERYRWTQKNTSAWEGIYHQSCAAIVDTKCKEADKKTMFINGAKHIHSANGTSHLKTDYSNFPQLDKRAMQLSRLGIYGLENIARKLTQGCQSDTEIARVLFRWVVEKDFRQRRSADRPPRQSYHRLYQTLCRLSGLPCEIIRGYSKGAGYKPGMRIGNNSFRNCWTAVAIDDTWGLVNCTWAARDRGLGKSNTVDEYYFLTDPKVHIYQHFPDDPAWQLLESPISQQAFVQLPMLKSNYFTCGLHLTGEYTSAILCDDGRSEIRLLVPDHIDIGSCLTSCDRPARVIDGQTSLRWENNEAIFTVYSSRPESVYFSVYAGKFGETLESACCFSLNFQNTAFGQPCV